MNILFRNVNLIDGTGADPLPSVNVVVENGVISWIGEGNVSSLNHPHYEEINGQDLTLLPGTLDCHEHFCGDGGRYGVRIMSQEEDRGILFGRAAANARRALMAGQTSARDVGSPHGISITLARAVAAGSIPGPRITASGQWIQFPTTWSGASSRTVETPDQMRDVITAQIAQGAGLIKVGATGEREDGTGFGTLGLEVAKLVADMAHAAGLKAAAHCWYALPEDTPGVFEGARQAVRRVQLQRRARLPGHGQVLQGPRLERVVVLLRRVQPHPARSPSNVRRTLSSTLNTMHFTAFYK